MYYNDGITVPVSGVGLRSIEGGVIPSTTSPHPALPEVRTGEQSSVLSLVEISPTNMKHYSYGSISQTPVHFLFIL